MRMPTEALELGICSMVAVISLTVIMVNLWQGMKRQPDENESNQT